MLKPFALACLTLAALSACAHETPQRTGSVDMQLLSTEAKARAASPAYEAVKLADVDAGQPYNVREIPVTNAHSLDGVHIAAVTAHGFEEVELTYPLHYLRARGAVVDVIAPDWIKTRVMAVQFLKPSIWIPVTKNISQANVDDYQAIMVPGGAWNPIIMRTDNTVLDFVRAAYAKHKLVASVCHGPQVLLSAGLAKGHEITGVGDIRADLAAGGGHVHDDKPLVIDGNLLTSRDPHDLAEFSQGIEAYLVKAKR